MIAAKEYTALTVQELRTECRTRGIRAAAVGSATKAQLIDALEGRATIEDGTPGAHLVGHEGISPASVAETAAKWLGLPPLWKDELERDRAQIGALQTIPEPAREWAHPTPEERAENAKYWREQAERDRAAAALQAATRMEKVNTKGPEVIS